MAYLTTIEPKLHYPCARDVSDLGIAIIGAGGIVDKKHCPAYRKHGLPIVGIYDINPDAAQVVAQTHGIARVYASLDELFNDSKVKIIDLAIPNQGRLEIITAAAVAAANICWCKSPLPKTLRRLNNLSPQLPPTVSPLRSIKTGVGRRRTQPPRS